MVSAGSPDNAMVLRKGSDTEMASSIEVGTMNLILAAPGVKRDSTGGTLGSGEIVVVIAQDKMGAPDGQVSNVLVRGVSESALKVHPEVHVVDGRPPTPGTDEVMIGRGLVGRFAGMRIGDKFDLKKNRPVNVVGVFEAGGASFESEVWANIDTAASSFGREGLVNSVVVRLDSPSKFDAFQAAVENDKRLGLEASIETKYYEHQSRARAVHRNLGGIISFFFAFGAIFGAIITMHAASRKDNARSARSGARLLAQLDSVLLPARSRAARDRGGVVGLIGALALGSTKLSMMNFQTWQEVTFSFDANPAVLIRALVWGAVMGIVGGAWPAIRAARISASSGDARGLIGRRLGSVRNLGAKVGERPLHQTVYVIAELSVVSIELRRADGRKHSYPDELRRDAKAPLREHPVRSLDTIGTTGTRLRAATQKAPR
jgi:putative ABC transport system permease protein